LIVANLPYLSAEDMATLSPEVRHEPASALDGGRDGMHLLGALVQQVAERRWRCRLVLEIGATQGPPFVELARSLLPSARVTIERDLAGLDRVAIVEPNGSE
jgi:release factor glutamine methyltransferase